MSAARRAYLSDAAWALLASLLPPPCARPRKWPERLVAGAVFYVPAPAGR